MSVRASSWAWEHSKSTGSAFLVLLALADHAGDDGGDCWPSVGRLARRCRLGERTVQDALAKLREIGELAVEEQGGKGAGHTNRYRILMGASSAPMAPNKGANGSKKGADHRGEGCESRTRTVINRQEPRASSASPLATLRNQRPECPLGLCDGSYLVEVNDGSYVQCECVEVA